MISKYPQRRLERRSWYNKYLGGWSKYPTLPCHNRYVLALQAMRTSLNEKRTNDKQTTMVFPKDPSSSSSSPSMGVGVWLRLYFSPRNSGYNVTYNNQPEFKSMRIAEERGKMSMMVVLVKDVDVYDEAAAYKIRNGFIRSLVEIILLIYI